MKKVFRCLVMTGAVALANLPAAEIWAGDVTSASARVTGWRSDGSGKYPNADPPVHWSRVEKSMLGLKSAAAIPADAAAKAAASAARGFFAEWLVAGPVKCADPVQAIKEELTPGEASLAPQAGDKLGDATWKLVTVDDSYVDVWKTFGGMTGEHAAYAQACLWTEEPMKVRVHVRYKRGIVIWFNGTHLYANPEEPVGYGATVPILTLELKAGWNRFLFKVTPQPKPGDGFTADCYIRCRFWLAEGPWEYDEKNIAWASPMPGLSMAMPVIMGDRIFTTGHPYNLVCVDKKTGRVLWVRQNSPFDAATAAERKAKPDLFAKMDELAAKRAAFYAEYVAGRQPTEPAVKEETDIEDELDKLMIEADPKKYGKPKEQDGEWWETPTPVSDGKSICLWMTRGTSASYDLEGRRRWIRFDTPGHEHHGWFGSPTIADDKLIVVDGSLAAINLSDGSDAWRVNIEKLKNYQLWYGSIIPVVFAGKEYVCIQGNTLVDPRDGQFRLTGANSFTATPVVEGDRILYTEYASIPSLIRLKTNANDAVTADRKTLKWPASQLNPPGFYGGAGALLASPLLHEGLGYFVGSSGVLTVFDLETGDAVYQKELPADIAPYSGHVPAGYFGASVTLAGKYIYLTGCTGMTIVIRPGRTYEEVARNQVQHICRAGRMCGYYGYNPYNTPVCPEYQESTMSSTPVFEGNRMYFRGQERLYCIGGQ